VVLNVVNFNELKNKNNISMMYAAIIIAVKKFYEPQPTGIHLNKSSSVSRKVSNDFVLNIILKVRTPYDYQPPFVK
jgi:hypothetical protein